ncbi:CapA family protein [Neobacillus pocheonensis]|uniref:CapA family protein n=1 Tax=Neobacillus pocheonensis TaxID=363869 RepID=UPI003D293FCC
MAKQIRIAAVGDIAVLHEPKKDIWKGIWEEADIRLANLEAPIIENPGAPADKLVRMKQPLKTGEWLRNLKTTAVSLANNHMLDWGVPGLEQTCQTLEAAGIKFTGAGANFEESRRPVFLKVDGYTIAFLSWSSTVPPGYQALNNRPGIASVRIKSYFQIDSSILDEQPGTPPYIQTVPVEDELIQLEETLEQVRNKADFVILSMHWGVPPQWSSVPQDPIAEYQKIVSKRVVEKGVDVIVGHHAHAPFGFEEYFSSQGKSVPVLYSLGNYIFHPEFVPGGMDKSTFHVPYNMFMLPENHQSCMAELVLEEDSATGRLSIEQMVIHPAMLDEIGEPVEGSAEQRQQVAERLHRFTQKRGTITELVNQKVVWKRKK